MRAATSLLPLPLQLEINSHTAGGRTILALNNRRGGVDRTMVAVQIGGIGTPGRSMPTLLGIRKVIVVICLQQAGGIRVLKNAIRVDVGISSVCQVGPDFSAV